jgi:protoheme IX farnesyltransferase
MSKLRFHHYAWGLLGYSLAVILGGAFVRATISGDGCGAHWPLCNGVLIPNVRRLATLIESSHRLTTVVLLFLVLGLLAWAFRGYPKGHMVRTGAVLILLCTLAEALVGAGLVLYKLVAHDQSVYRAVAMPTHLVVTFLLLAAETLTIWWGSGGQGLRFRGQGMLGWALALGLLATLLLGVTGALTALGDTLFPARSLAESHRQALDPSAHFLIARRIYHPVVAIATGLYLALIAGLAMRLRSSERVQTFARVVVMLFCVQMCLGLLNLGLLAPVWMQLVHLLFADLFWVSLVFLAAAVLSEQPETIRVQGFGGAGTALPPAERPLASAPCRVPSAGWRDYLALTKPRVISLLLLTTLAAMFIAAGGETGLVPSFGLCVAVGLGLYMAAGAANAINMVLERDLDLAMGRTASRPTVTETIPPANALWFAFVLMIGSFALLWWSANLLSAFLAQAGLAFYIIVYTLLLKRRTWYNIVIGGAAGAFPPLVGWAAVTGNLNPLAWCLFGIVFLWTPVHFWALAIMLKDDYARAGVPMLPVVRGERATVAQIGYYTVLTVAVSALPLLLPGSRGGASVGWLYLGTAALLNGVLVMRSFQLYRHPDHARARSLFKYSMVYLALLFLAMAADRARWI